MRLRGLNQDFITLTAVYATHFYSSLKKNIRGLKKVLFTAIQEMLLSEKKKGDPNTHRYTDMDTRSPTHAHRHYCV